MTMVGADADRLEAAAAQMRRAADELDEHSGSLTRQLGGLSWLGQVAGAFLNMWNGHHNAHLKSTAQFIRDAAAKLVAQAKQQRDASAATGASAGVKPASKAKPVPVNRPATQDEIKAAVKQGLIAVKTSRKPLPGASSKLEAWAKELETGEHSLAEVKAFLKYREMIVTANGMRATVGSAAESGIEAHRDAIKDGAKVALSLASAGIGKAGGGSVLGEKMGSVEAAEGGTLANIERVAKLGDNLTDGPRDIAAARYIEHAKLGLESGDPVAIRQAYEARADAFLSAAEGKFRSSTTMSNTDPAQIRTNAINEYAGKYEVAVAQGQVAGAFNVGPDWLTTPLSAGMNVLVPYSGTATFAALGAASAGAHAAASVGYLNVATDASMDQLARSMVAMNL
jgi:hypothetical protein